MKLELLFKQTTATQGQRAILLVRLMVGAGFFEEGIQKFLFAGLTGAGRFARIGIPAPEVMGPFVGTVGILCGALILAGLLTRLAAVPLLINISVAFIFTKIPILLGHDFFCFHVPKLARFGFWSMVSEARTDFCMFLGLVFLLIAGAGPVSRDAHFNSNQKVKNHA